MNDLPHTIDGPCTITAAIDSLVELANVWDEINQESPSEALMLRITGLAIITQLATEYSKEWFSQDEINFIEDMHDVLSFTGDNSNEQQ